VEGIMAKLAIVPKNIPLRVILASLFKIVVSIPQKYKIITN
jgi:hypothetical protein